MSSNSFSPAVSGTGKHEIISSFLSPNGCTDTLRRIIEVIAPPALEGDMDFDILLGGEKQIDLKILADSDLRYQWTPSIGLSNDKVLNPIAFPQKTTIYTLEVNGPGNCSFTKQVTVKVHIDPDIPNAFSPNGDGYNDSWAVKFLETLPKANIRIFNRYGQEIFYSQQYTKPWDGRYQNQPVPSGVYYYIIEPNNGHSKYTGSITLIR